MLLKEFLNIAYKNFEYMEIDSKDGLTKSVFNLNFGSSSLIPFLDRDVKYIFYDKNRPMCITIGLSDSFTFTLPCDDPSTHLLIADDYEEAEKINSFINKNRKKGFLMVYSCSVNIVSPPSIWWLVYQWDD